MTSQEANIRQLVEIVNCDPDIARDTLIQCGLDLNRAIDILCSSPVRMSTTKASPPKPKLKLDKYPMIPEKKTEKFIAATNAEFQQARTEAQDKGRWIVVLLTEKPLPITKLKDPSLKDFTNIRFVPLEINREQSVGQWFYSIYQVHALPYYAIIDPDTKECLDHIHGHLTSSKIADFLKSFLNDHPEKGGLLEEDLNNFMDSSDSISSSSESDSDSPIETNDSSSNVHSKNNANSEIENEVPAENGNLATVLIQLPNRKKMTIEIGENSTLLSLYKKVASLLNYKLDEFALFIPFPQEQLIEKSKTISELKLNKSTLILRTADDL